MENNLERKDDASPPQVLPTTLRPLPNPKPLLKKPPPVPKMPQLHHSLPTDVPPPIPIRPDLSKSHSLVDIKKFSDGPVDKPPIPPKNSPVDIQSNKESSGVLLSLKPIRPPPQPISVNIQEIKDTEEDNHARRTNIVNEILNTEKTYVSTLISLTTTWSDPIMKQNPEEPIVPFDQVKYLFSNVEVILNVNKKFLEDYEDKMKLWSPTQCVGIVFLTLIPFFKVYMQYINNYNKSMEIYQELLRKKAFRKYIDECSKVESSPYDNLASYLITPVQRIPRYQLLLAELYRYTPESHPDYVDLGLALDKIKTVANDINSHKRDAENLHACAVIQNNIIYPEDMKRHKALVSPTRRLKGEGEYEIFLNGAKTPCNYIVAFSDALLIAKRKKKGIFYYGFLYLGRLCSPEIDGDGINIKSQSFISDTIYLSIPDQEEREKWVGFLEKPTLEIPANEEDELLLQSLDLHSSTSKEKQKMSLRKRFMTLGKVKDKLDKEKDKVKKEEDARFQPSLNHELIKKLEVRKQFCET